MRKKSEYFCGGNIVSNAMQCNTIIERLDLMARPHRIESNRRPYASYLLSQRSPLVHDVDSILMPFSTSSRMI